MKIKTLEVAGIGPAVRAMRNPYQNYNLSDTKHGMIGPKDMALSDRLARAGGSHSKHLRMIQVWVEIWGPLFWLKEVDTYKVGTVRLSTSTMHTIMREEFKADMFTGYVDGSVISLLNLWRGFWLVAENEDDKRYYWRKIIENLPCGFIQRATFCLNYQTLRAIYKDREGHRLSEWQDFREWCETLPESWMITGKLPEPPEPVDDDSD